MANYSLNKNDRWCLNIFWFYGSGMITEEQFLEAIEKIKYDITLDNHIQ